MAKLSESNMQHVESTGFMTKTEHREPLISAVFQRPAQD
jgi:hypothetical protein